jgi:heat shock protein HslJ
MTRRLTVVGALALFAVALMALGACGSSDDEPDAGAAPGGPLQGTWDLTRYASDGVLRELPAGLTTEITFAGDRVSGRAAVNTYRGTFESDGVEGTLSIGPLASTKIGGSPEADAAETDYLAALESAATFSSDGQRLTIADSSGETVLTFEASDATIVGAWTVTGYNNGKEAVVGLEAGSEITAVFGDDLTLTGDSGVNSYRTSYTTSEGAAGVTEISIAPPAATLKAGPPELMEQEQRFLRALESAATYTIQADELVLRDASDAIAVTLTLS